VRSSKYIKPIALIVIAIIFTDLIISSPLGLLTTIMDPFHGIILSAGNGVASNREFTVPGISDKVIIVFDKHWIPQVFASNEEDAYFAVGFLHGWFRLWQLDLERRLASGELSEIIGKGALKSDIYMRIIGLRRSAISTVKWIKENKPDIYKLLEAYSNGVNYAIKKMEEEDKLPLMFKLLNYKPRPWSPVDSIVWAKYMAWSLTNFFEPLKYSYLVAKLGADDVNILWPVHPYYQDNITVVPGNGSINGKSIKVDPYMLRKLNWFDEWATGLNFSNPLFKAKVEKAVLDALRLVGELPRELGSNDWAVSPSRSINGYALMADDPHLYLSLPAIWYAIRVKVGNIIDVYGVTLPGIPFVLIGHNKYIAWGLTNTQIGVMDFYVEKVDPKNPLRYYYKGSWHEMKQIREIIKVRGGKTYTLLVNITVHGPVLTNKGLTISFKWTGNAGFKDDNSGVTREAIAIYYVNKARNLNEFINALKYWDVPSQNFMYADIYGNIAVIEPGLFPIREVTIPNGKKIIVEGSRSLLNGTGNYEWIGYIPYEDVPHAINPSRGFLAAPNQMSIGPYYPYFILGAWWDPGARAHRIFIDLTSKEKYSARDMMRYQSDITDWYASSMLKKLINTVRSRLTGLYRDALNILEKWDYRMDKDEVAPTIWWAWISVLQDKMYKEYFMKHGIDKRFYPTMTTTLWLINNMENSKWFPDGFNTTVLESYKDAIDMLKKSLGNDITSWKWGRIHRLYIRHLSGLRALSRGPYPEDGGAYILMNAPFPFDIRALNETFYVSSGPSWRIVAEMGEKLTIYGIYPGGESGNPASTHYDDLISLWMNYKYIQIEYPGNPSEFSNSTAIIILKPGG